MTKPSIVQNPTRGSYKGDPAKAERRARMAAHWLKNPTATVQEVADCFGVSRATAQDAKPRSLRQGHGIAGARASRRSDADRLALKMYYEDAPLADIAAATGRSTSTTLRFLREVATPDTTATPDPGPRKQDPAPTCTIYSADGSSWIEGGNA